MRTHQLAFALTLLVTAAQAQVDAVIVTPKRTVADIWSNAPKSSFGTDYSLRLCREYIRAGTHEKKSWETWARGFVVGQSTADGEDLHQFAVNWDHSTAAGKLLVYCSQHATTAFWQAVAHIRAELTAESIPNFVPVLNVDSIPAKP